MGPFFLNGLNYKKIALHLKLRITLSKLFNHKTSYKKKLDLWRTCLLSCDPPSSSHLGDKSEKKVSFSYKYFIRTCTQTLHFVWKILFLWEARPPLIGDMSPKTFIFCFYALPKNAADNYQSKGLTVIYKKQENIYMYMYKTVCRFGLRHDNNLNYIPWVYFFSSCCFYFYVCLSVIGRT